MNQPEFKISLSEGIRLWQLILVKVRLNLRSEASQSYLSYAWWVLEPLLHMMVFYVVFSILLKRGTEDFIVFLLCGLVPMLWFNKSIGNTSGSILQGRGLIAQTYLPKWFFPVVVVGQDLVKQFFSFALLIVFVVAFEYYPHWGWLWLIPVILTQLLLIIAASLIVSFIVPFARDIQYLINAGLMLLMIGSGVFYSYKDVLIPQHRDIFLMNPMANLIVSYRQVLMDGSAPLVGSLFVIAAVSVLFILFMSRMMKTCENTLTRLALE